MEGQIRGGRQGEQSNVLDGGWHSYKRIVLRILLYENQMLPISEGGKNETKISRERGLSYFALTVTDKLNLQTIGRSLIKPLRCIVVVRRVD